MSGKYQDAPREKCRICGKSGLIGEEIAFTASNCWVHHGDCHRELINREIEWREKQKREKDGRLL